MSAFLSIFFILLAFDFHLSLTNKIADIRINNMKTKKFVKQILMLALCVSVFATTIYAAAPQAQIDEKLVGIWKKDGDTATIVFRKDGTGTQVIIANFSADFVWNVNTDSQIKLIGKMFANVSKSKREEMSTTYDYILNGNELMLNGVTYTRIR